MSPLPDLAAALNRAEAERLGLLRLIREASPDAADELVLAYLRAHHAIRAARAALTLRDAR